MPAFPKIILVLFLFTCAISIVAYAGVKWFNRF